ncbi:hypothetical protein [Bacillus sp. Marseille-Q1617]|uniref:hypothetical protein n=1 Tax=Bacillus sp. Marseille-Q1617 TaxID=2736887 RepID=UPI00158AF4BE|nr:hypothetical protein [Bacillus sp. Marseille-Q1617]
MYPICFYSKGRVTGGWLDESIEDVKKELTEYVKEALLGCIDESIHFTIDGVSPDKAQNKNIT